MTLNQIRNGFLDTISNYSLPLPTPESPGSNQVLAFSQLKGTDDPYLEHEFGFVGRTQEIHNVVELLTEQKLSKILVCGTGGLGKTAFCKAILKQLCSAWDRPLYWINVENIKSKNELQSVFAQLAGLKPESNLQAVLNGLEQICPALFYLDNLESALEDQETLFLLDALTKVYQSAWLGSSREKMARWYGYRLDTLDQESAQTLFQNAWLHHGGPPFEHPFPLDLKAFISKDLARHPLSLILTASHATDYPSFQHIIRDWKALERDVGTRYATPGEHKSQSLGLSIGLSLERIKERPGAIRLWMLCALVPEGMRLSTENDLQESGVFDTTDRAKLLSTSILFRNQANELALLPPLQRFVFQEFSKEASVFREEVLFDKGMDYLVIEETDDRYYELGPKLNFAFGFLDYYADKLETYPELLELEDRMFNLYQYDPFRSLSILSVLSTSPKLQEEAFQSTYSYVLFSLGKIEFLLANNDSARQLFNQAQALYQKTGDEQGLAHTFSNLGQIEFQLANYEHARQLFNQAQALYQKTGDELGLANTFWNLGQIEFRLANNERARQLFNQAQALYQKTGSELGLANTFSNLGEIEFQLANHDSARQLFNQAQALYQKTGSEQGIANTFRNLGEIEFRLANHDSARQLFNQAQALYQKTGSEQGIANTLISLGHLERSLGNTTEAHQFYLLAQELYLKTEDTQGIAASFYSLGDLEKSIQNYSEALTYYQTALELYEQVEYKDFINALKDDIDLIKKKQNSFLYKIRKFFRS